MKYTPNTRVTLKPNLQVGGIYNEVSLFPNIIQQAYKLPYLTIDYIDEDGDYKMKEIKGYYWKEEMIEGLYETPTYIRITSCLRPNCWYANKIGKVYKVKEENKGAFLYIVDIINGKCKCIEIIDTEPVTIAIGSKVKVKKYKGQDLHGIPVEEYKALIGKKLTIVEIVKGIYYYCKNGDGYGLHESLIKPV